MTKQEYLDNQTQSEFFKIAIKNKKMQSKNGSMCVKEIEMRIQIEILKELQFLNSKQ